MAMVDASLRPFQRVRQWLEQKRATKSAGMVLPRLFGDYDRQNGYVREFFMECERLGSFSHGRVGLFDALMLFVVTRTSRPEVVVETGVASGKSSAIILRALALNGTGRLYSIDLPRGYGSGGPDIIPTGEEARWEYSGYIPEGRKPGWMIPGHLRNRWELLLGPSREHLPSLVERLGRIDMFFHVSDHSYENMRFELETVWSAIAPEGIILADDVQWHGAFSDFVRAHSPSFSDERHGLGVLKR